MVASSAAVTHALVCSEVSVRVPFEVWACMCVSLCASLCVPVCVCGGEVVHGEENGFRTLSHGREKRVPP